jgi:RNA polymerase sigma factor (sigma-70 family)
MEASAVPREAPAGVSVFSTPALLRLASDSHLVSLIREGRAAAFEIAYDRHHRAILSFCRHMLGDPDEAQDAVQHTFLAAYNDLIGSTKQIHLRAWLFTIARNRCYSILRGRREHPTSEINDAVTEGLATQVQRRQDLRDLVGDMRQLPEEQRAALVLAELDSLSHQEIGEVLGVPKDKVKALVFQARESLLASRKARETDCAEIREQLATQRGGALRRSNLRRHLRECAGCREYRKLVERQRRQLAIALPVLGTVAMKDAVVGGVAGGAGAGLGGGLIAGGLLKGGGFGKLVLGTVLGVVGAAGTIVATSDLGFLRSAPAQPLMHKPVPGRFTAPASSAAAAHGKRLKGNSTTAQGVAAHHHGMIPGVLSPAHRHAVSVAPAHRRSHGAVRGPAIHRHAGARYHSAGARFAPRYVPHGQAPGQASPPPVAFVHGHGHGAFTSHGRGHAYGHDRSYGANPSGGAGTGYAGGGRTGFTPPGHSGESHGNAYGHGGFGQAYGAPGGDSAGDHGGGGDGGGGDGGGGDHGHGHGYGHRG